MRLRAVRRLRSESWMLVLAVRCRRVVESAEGVFDLVLDLVLNGLMRFEFGSPIFRKAT